MVFEVAKHCHLFVIGCDEDEVVVVVLVFHLGVNVCLDVNCFHVFDNVVVTEHV